MVLGLSCKTVILINKLPENCTGTAQQRWVPFVLRRRRAQAGYIILGVLRSWIVHRVSLTKFVKGKCYHAVWAEAVILAFEKGW